MGVVAPLMQTPVRLSEMCTVLGCSERRCGVFGGVFGSPRRVELESREGEGKLLNSFGVSPHRNFRPQNAFAPTARNSLWGSPKGKCEQIVPPKAFYLFTFPL